MLTFVRLIHIKFIYLCMVVVLIFPWHIFSFERHCHFLCRWSIYEVFPWNCDGICWAVCVTVRCVCHIKPSKSVVKVYISMKSSHCTVYWQSSLFTLTTNLKLYLKTNSVPLAFSSFGRFTPNLVPHSQLAVCTVTTVHVVTFWRELL